MNIIATIDLFYKFAKTTDVKRGKVVVEAEHELNESNKDKFPINKPSEARKAIIRVHEMHEPPNWWGGSLSELQGLVMSKVKDEYDATEKNGRWIVKMKNV